MGWMEKTHYDSELETLLKQFDKIKSSTEKMLNFVTYIVEPVSGKSRKHYLCYYTAGINDVICHYVCDGFTVYMAVLRTFC